MAKHILAIAICAIVSACSSNHTSVPMESDGPAIEISGAKSIFIGGHGVVERTDNLASEAKAHAPKKKLPYKRKTQNKSDYSGISYWIERYSNAGMQRVTTSSSFNSGDRVRLHVRSNRSGYLYIVNEGTSGRSNFLFPATINDREYIDANRTYTIPAHGGYIRFDNQPGHEIVWLFLSQYPLPPDTSTPNQSIPLDSPMKVASYSPCGSKDLLVEDPANLQSSCGMGSKDLVVEDDSAPRPTPANVTSLPAEYAVGPAELMKRGQILGLRFVLRHH